MENIMKTIIKIKLFVQGFIMFNILWYIAAVLVNMKALPRPTEIYFNMSKLYGKNL